MKGAGAHRGGRLITIGSFDGVHRGHAALLETTVREAARRKLKAAALTFQVPPKMILEEWKRRLLLTDPLEKRLLLGRSGMEEVIEFAFNQDIARTGPFSFFRDILLGRFRARGVVVGLDFRFGADRSAGAIELVRWGEEFGIPVWAVPPVKWSREVVSSTSIRTLLMEGKFRRAIDLLGHPYLVAGRVVEGRGAGRHLGFPTANIAVSADKVLPQGVFAVRGRLGGRGPLAATATSFAGVPFEGVCNIGYRPTLVAGSPLAVEVHLFGPWPGLVGRLLSIDLLHKLRDEKKFASTAHLVKAIQVDIAKAKVFLKKR